MGDPVTRHRAAASLGLALALLVGMACDDDAPSTGGAGTTSTGAGAAAGSSGAGAAAGSASAGGAGGAGASGQGGAGGAALGPYVATSAIVSPHHRFIDGAMFGGWGPHLGHRVSLAEGDYLVDDVCAQPGDAALAACDVNDDHTLGYYRRDANGWTRIATVSPPGVVQQNTATIASDAALYTYGVDVAGSALIECSLALPDGPPSCAALPFALGPNANYVGAAISPEGYRVVWWTQVADGGGGSFHYIVDYGAGWNGPRSGDVAGYNDASYIHAAFSAGPRLELHAQLVSGIAPSWTFTAAHGSADLTTSDAVAWQIPFTDLPGPDPLISTNDLFVDAHDDAHVLARSGAGDAAYFHRPSGGAFGAAAFTLPATFRARFVPHGDRLALVYGVPGGLGLRVTPLGAWPAGQPIDWGALPEQIVPLPAGYESTLAIYPAAPPYQVTPPATIELAVVGATRQNELLAVSLAPGL